MATSSSSSLNVSNNSNQQLIGYKIEIDDTIPLQFTIEATETINDHVEYILRVHRGYDTKYSWIIRKRYREFDNLNSELKLFNCDLKMPPKKYIGNMDKEFISSRQLGLQEFLEKVLSNHVLSNTIYVKKFLNEQSYTENYRENAIEHVSMFLRSEFKWQINENLNEIGWRFRKQYMTVNNTDEKQKYLLSWCDYGPDKVIKDTDLTPILQQLSLIQHEYIQPIVKLHNSEYGVLFIQSYNEKGSLRDHIFGVNKIQNSFLKKYSVPKTAKPLKIDQIKLWSKQILETLKFIYSKGFFYGHLHSGNILIEDNKIKLTDLHNSLMGLPYYYRQYVIEQRKTQNIELIDVYGFGHVLYEMCYGEPLNRSFKDDFQDCPIYEARHVLESILSSSSNKNGLPTISQLLELPFFNQIKIDQSIVVNTFKFFTSNKYKDSFFKIREQIEKRINEEQKILFKLTKKTKAEAKVLSDKEKQKRRKEQKAELRTQASLEFGTPPLTPTSPATPNGSVPINKTNQIHVSSSSKSLSSSVTSNSSTLLSMSPVSPPPPPPAPPMPNGLSSPPPAPPPPPPQSNNPPKSSDRTQLLSSIEGFSKNALKKTVTVDKSKPKVK